MDRLSMTSPELISKEFLAAILYRAGAREALSLVCFRPS